MTKSEVKNLEKRVRGLDPQSSSTDDARDAHMDWLVSHWTDEERWEAAMCFKRLMADEGDKEAEERIRVLLVEAERRGDEEVNRKIVSES